jgi:hypothetical protein
MRYVYTITEPSTLKADIATLSSHAAEAEAGGPSSTTTAKSHGIRTTLAEMLATATHCYRVRQRTTAEGTYQRHRQSPERTKAMDMRFGGSVTVRPIQNPVGTWQNNKADYFTNGLPLPPPALERPVPPSRQQHARTRMRGVLISLHALVGWITIPF